MQEGKMQKVLELLEKDSKLTIDKIATMTGMSKAEVAQTIKKAEDEKLILRYKTVVDWGKLGRETVLALIEVKVVPQRNVGFDSIAERIYQFPQVKSVYLASGTYDLAVIVSGSTMHEVAVFVSEKLSPLDKVQGTVTHFILKTYKEDGEIFGTKPDVNRLPIIP
jgi:DNA-binding Lrp family transcriptional regulator